MDSKFYNAFATSSTTMRAEILNLDNALGTNVKTPKILSMEDYNGWCEHFCNWVQANAMECWFSILEEYVEPVNEQGVKKTLMNLNLLEKEAFIREKKMINLFQQSIKDDIFSLLQHTNTAHSIWIALKKKYEGGREMMKSKKALLKKEFDIFNYLKSETLKQMIERYCHLIIELRKFDIEKDREELVDKLIDAKPNESDWSTYVLNIKNSREYETMSLNMMIQKLKSYELE
ncbi:hypothetical protein HanLR1_Chr01g0021711 [Helianthus annuus]|nr:hypothetical protein HanLR1_Chr01g0021711 [Helianthus annuus]